MPRFGRRFLGLALFVVPAILGCPDASGLLDGDRDEQSDPDGTNLTIRARILDPEFPLSIIPGLQLDDNPPRGEPVSPGDGLELNAIRCTPGSGARWSASPEFSPRPGMDQIDEGERVSVTEGVDFECGDEIEFVFDSSGDVWVTTVFVNGQPVD